MHFAIHHLVVWNALASHAQYIRCYRYSEMRERWICMLFRPWCVTKIAHNLCVSCFVSCFVSRSLCVSFRSVCPRNGWHWLTANVVSLSISLFVCSFFVYVDSIYEKQTKRTYIWCMNWAVSRRIHVKISFALCLPFCHIPVRSPWVQFRFVNKNRK